MPRGMKAPNDWPADPVNLFHGSDHIGHMFQHIDPEDLVKVIILERVGENIQIMDDICLGFRISIQTNGPADLPVSTSYV